MRQSSVIFGTLLLAFVIYITMRGQMPAYIALFKPKQTDTASKSDSFYGNDTLDGLADMGDGILDKAKKITDKAKKFLGKIF